MRWSKEDEPVDFQIPSTGGVAAGRGGAFTPKAGSRSQPNLIVNLIGSLIDKSPD